MMTCNVISPQLFWFKKIRRSLLATFALSIVVNIGMWFERYVIIVTSIHRDYDPSSWGEFHPTHASTSVSSLEPWEFSSPSSLGFARFFPVLGPERAEDHPEVQR